MLSDQEMPVGRRWKIGLAGFEPTASSSRTRRATRLRYSPLCAKILVLLAGVSILHFRGCVSNGGLCAGNAVVGSG